VRGISGILVLAAALRLAGIAFLRTYLHPQTWEFGKIAKSLVTGHGFTLFPPYLPSAFMPPGYPLVLAGVFSVFGDGPRAYLILEIVQASLGILLVYLVYLLALTLFKSDSKARLAAMYATVYPPFIEMCNEFHSINFYIVVGLAAVLFLIKAIQNPEATRYWIRSSVCIGTLLFFRAEAVLLVVLFAALLGCRRVHRSFAVRPLLYMALAYCFLVPWTLRNYHIFHTLIPTTTSGGTNLWVGHNPNATGGDRGHTRDVPPQLQAEIDQYVQPQDYELRQDRMLRGAAVRYMAAHPKQDILLTGKKLLMFWTFDPTHEKGRLPSYWVPSILLSILAGAGLLNRRRPRLLEVAPILVMIAFSSILAMVYFTLPRYKVVIDPLLCVLAANAPIMFWGPHWNNQDS